MNKNLFLTAEAQRKELKKNKEKGRRWKNGEEIK